MVASRRELEFDKTRAVSRTIGILTVLGSHFEVYYVRTGFRRLSLFGKSKMIHNFLKLINSEYKVESLASHEDNLTYFSRTFGENVGERMFVKEERHTDSPPLTTAQAKRLANEIVDEMIGVVEELNIEYPSQKPGNEVSLREPALRQECFEATFRGIHEARKVV
jgi:hypothetical protein